MAMNTQESLGLFSKMQQKVDAIFASLNISARDIISYVTFFGIGFLFGLGFKRYGKWIIAITLSAIAIIATLHYFELISVHHAKVRCLLGLADVHTIDDLLTLLQTKFQKFWIEVILLITAIIVGFKLG